MSLIKTSAQQSILIGAWQGKLMGLRLVFHITEKDRKLNATMDSPDQGANGIICDHVTMSENTVIISVSMIGGNYTGTLSEDKKLLTGKWSQGGGSFDLILGKDRMPAEKPKQQTPQPPFNYKVEEVEYDNADKSVHLGATLTYPSTGSKFPAAILISGSGQQDRDESIMGHKPFAVIADHLTKLGFAVLRVDDRGVGKSKGEVEKASSADFAKDVITSIEYLKKRSEIDASKIGLIGHSEGGIIASVVAAERKDIDFIIFLAGPGIKGAELLAEQGDQMLLKEGVSEAAVKAYSPLYKKFIEISLTETDLSKAQQAAKKEYAEWQSTVKAEKLEELGFTTEKMAEAIIDNLMKEFSAPWMQYFLKSDPSVFIEQTTAKVLALNGENDIQVLPASNTDGIKKALEKSKSPVHEVKVMPGLNHLFQKCKKCSVIEYGELEETFSPEALGEIGNWLKKNVLK
jgi:alpha/beta superfamily hydrolase